MTRTYLLASLLLDMAESSTDIIRGHVVYRETESSWIVDDAAGGLEWAVGRILR